MRFSRAPMLQLCRSRGFEEENDQGPGQVFAGSSHSVRPYLDIGACNIHLWDRGDIKSLFAPISEAQDRILFPTEPEICQRKELQLHNPRIDKEGQRTEEKV